MIKVFTVDITNSTQTFAIFTPFIIRDHGHSPCTMGGSQLDGLPPQAAISIENARLYADLQSTQDEYRALYDNAIEGLFRISPQGVLLSANPTLARILGFENVLALLDEYRELLDRVTPVTQDALAAVDERDFAGAGRRAGESRIVGEIAKRWGEPLYI